ncbi:sigma 54-interacting transcriptional regulator [Candidatus Manganitrophus noduliformans]|uniref:sigma 54-interacting transcriptional regulator n=1 Tax=Candidatus Manganitrophus noduliformans TaxID=2606439 RepID=UPI003BEF2ED4
MSLQAKKLLKTFEDKVIRRIGNIREQKVDVRIVTATNQSLEEAVRQGRFRSDLFFRLRIINLELPPLRSRGNDILLLAEHFLTINRGATGNKECALAPKPKKCFSIIPGPATSENFGT